MTKLIGRKRVRRLRVQGSRGGFPGLGGFFGSGGFPGLGGFPGFGGGNSWGGGKGFENIGNKLGKLLKGFFGR